MKTKNFIDNILPGRGDLTEKEFLIKLASETAAEEKALSDFGDMEYEKALREFKKNNPDKTEEDFINAIRRVQMSSGGKIIDFAKFRKSKDPKVKEIDLASLFTPGKTLASLSPEERDQVNMLLKLTLGKQD